MTPSISCEHWLPALLVFLASTPYAALADFTPVSDDRSVHADYFDPYYSDVQDDDPTVPFAAWLGDVVAGGAYWATLDSEAVAATRMAASGVANGFSEFGSATAIFSITFDVDAPTAYSLSGQLVEDCCASNDSSIALLLGTTEIFAADAVPEPGTGVLVGGGLALFAGVRRRRVAG